MTSKEAYYILIQAWHGNKDTYDYPSFDDINEAFDVLKQALERLEVLETSVLEYKDQEKLYWETAQNNVKLRQENEKLKAIEIIKNKKVNFGIFIVSQNAREYNKEITIKVNGKRWLRSNNCTLTQKEASAYDYLGKEIYKEEIDTIKQDLERLEALEKENEDLKEMLSVANYVGCGAEEKVWDLMQENEKLKKAFKILTQRIVIKAHRNFLFGGRHLDIASTTIKLTDEEYELLKEVLGNENHSE